MSLSQCIDKAINQSAAIEEANAKVDEFRARLLEVQANYYPKLSVMGYLAPMFTVTGDANSKIERDFSPGAWGPSTHLEALLAMPIYTFGRLEAGENAAKERLDVEKAKLREAQNHVKLEVSKFYYTYLYASTMLPHLKQAEETGGDIQKKAQEYYDSASGKVTKVDLMKLRYADAEIKKYILIAEEGIALSMSALKHTMGLSDSYNLVLDKQALPKPPKIIKLDSVTTLTELAIQNRPEWSQIRHGLKAISSLRQSQRKANKPVIFVAGTIESNWTPTRDDTTNPYQYDPYNDLFGGVAVGFKLDLDWKLNKAKLASINATQREVNALKQLAETGIPLQITKSRSEVTRFHQQINLSKKARNAANKWVVFSGAAYAAGTGEVKDVLEGIVASLSAKRDYYE
ncbi:MAG: TolC family protein, partial [Gammaproteobacteria bacterium]|nr:TolC family protein [Gammaproteobacteria bacterium]